jgi:hypothetical protein
MESLRNRFRPASPATAAFLLRLEGMQNPAFGAGTVAVGTLEHRDGAAFHLQCGWCRKWLRAAVDPDAPVTTGICAACFAEMEMELEGLLVARHEHHARG